MFMFVSDKQKKESCFDEEQQMEIKRISRNQLIGAGAIAAGAGAAVIGGKALISHFCHKDEEEA